MLKFNFNRSHLLIFLVLFIFSAVSLPVAQTQRLVNGNHYGELRGSVSPQEATIKVALYPYVPRLDQFERVISAAWAKEMPGVQLTFVKWDNYSEDPPQDLDVFVFDGIFLDYFVSKGFLATLKPGEIENPDDLLPYALNDSKIGGINYAIPQIGCGNILFYRKDDAALAKATTLSQINQALGFCTDDSVPPKGNNLIVDLQGSTTDACLYLETVQDITGQYTPDPTLPPPNKLNPTAVNYLHSLLITGCVLPSVSPSYNEVNYQGAKWFGEEGRGRATIGFTESLSAMGPGRKNVDFKLMPFADRTGINLFYVDLVGINRTVSPQRRPIALKLANLLASTNVIVDSFGPSSPPNDYPQYLMPVRRSVFEALKKNDPLYQQMYDLVMKSKPRMFRMGPGSREWLASAKKSIRQQILSGFPLVAPKGNKTQSTNKSKRANSIKSSAQ